MQFFCVLVPTFVVADEEGGADTKKGELQQNIEQQKEQGEQEFEERKQKRNELKERDEKAREDKKQKRDELKNVGKDTEE